MNLRQEEAEFHPLLLLRHDVKGNRFGSPDRDGPKVICFWRVQF